MRLVFSASSCSRLSRASFFLSSFLLNFLTFDFLSLVSQAVPVGPQVPVAACP